MCRAADRVALIQVVRSHTHQQQAVHELLHRFDIVVHAFQQHGLRPKRDSGVGQSAAGCATSGVHSSG